VKQTVHEQIEEMRIQMQGIASNKDLTDPIVVSISEKLDKLINEFYSQRRDSLLLYQAKAAQ